MGGIEQDLDVLFLGSRHIAADIIGADRQFPVAAVDQYGQLHAARPAQIDQGVHRRTNGPAGIEDIIDQHDPFVIERERDIGSADRQIAAGRQVVAVHGDVDGAKRHINLFNLGNALLQLGGKMVAAGADADQRQIFDPLVAFRISWAMRVRARPTPAWSRITVSIVAMLPPCRSEVDKKEPSHRKMGRLSIDVVERTGVIHVATFADLSGSA